MSAAQSQTAPRPFTFDTVFDGDRVIAPAKPRTAFTATELEAARAEGMAAGERSAIARAEAEHAAALAEAARHIAAALQALKALAHEHRVASAELALACGRAIAGAALEHAPEAAVASALDALAREIESAPRLLLRASPDQAERLGSALSRAAEAQGFTGAVVVKADPGLAPAAFAFDWGDGRCAFDPAAAAARVEAALAAALAAEGLHAEPPLAPEIAADIAADTAMETAPVSDLPLDEFDAPALPEGEAEEKTAGDLAPVFDVPVNISAVLGRASLSVAQLLKLGSGSVLELDRKVGEAIDIYVNNRLVARGEVVVVDERLGVTMTEIIKDGDAVA